MTAVVETATRKLHRAIEIRHVLDPGGHINYPHLDFAVDLALQHGWHVEPVRAGYDGPRAATSTRTIYTGPIVGDEALCIYVHEGGHVEDPDAGQRRYSPYPEGQHCRVSVSGELFAWRWAMKTLAHRWNKHMAVHMERCLWSYRTTSFRTYNHIVDPAERTDMDDLLVHSAEQARHIVRILR